MIIIAGPPGGGKSTAFPISASGVDWFDADQRCAALNGDSFFDIPASVRQRSASELAEFIEKHITDHQSFAFETTLRTEITLNQAARAKAEGFRVSMTYVALGDPELHVNRVAIRVDGGGHAAHPDQIRETYRASLKNLWRAFIELDDVAIYDNGANIPELLIDARDGRIVFRAESLPKWITDVLVRTR